jgi:DNA polymerase-3 subunit epsilon
MEKFTSVLFRLANLDKESIICVELSVVENGIIIDERYWLMNPECDFSKENSAQREHLEARDVADKPTLPVIWAEICPYFEGKIIVAQNTAHVITMLTHALKRYDIALPNFRFYDTKDLSKKTFGNFISYDPRDFASKVGLSYKYGLGTFSHFVAELMIKIFETNNCGSFSDLVEKFKISGGIFGDKYQPYHAAPLAPNFSANFDFIPNPDADTHHPFFGKYIAFTGKLSIDRKEAATLAAEKGAIPQGNINNKTNLLVIGDFGVEQLTQPGKSIKIVSAEQRLAAGQDIEIIGENEFLEMVN